MKKLIHYYKLFPPISMALSIPIIPLLAEFSIINLSNHEVFIYTFVLTCLSFWTHWLILYLPEVKK